MKTRETVEALIARAKSDVADLLARADLTATGATIHSIRSAVCALSVESERLDGLVSSNADPGRIFPAQKQYEYRRRVLELVLSGCSIEVARVESRIQAFGG